MSAKINQEEIPVACLFHPLTQALRVFMVKDNDLDQLFKYGLCYTCLPKLKVDSFKKALNARLTEVVNANVKREKTNAKTNDR